MRVLVDAFSIYILVVQEFSLFILLASSTLRVCVRTVKSVELHDTALLQLVLGHLLICSLHLLLLLRPLTYFYVVVGIIIIAASGVVIGSMQDITRVLPKMCAVNTVYATVFIMFLPSLSSAELR